MRLIVIRHGESYINTGDWRDLPSMDAGLTEKGQVQAQALHDWLKSKNTQGEALYSSTLLRARETALYVSRALGLAVRLDDRLREIGTVYANGQAVEESKLPRAFDKSAPPNKAPFLPRVVGLDNAESVVHLRLRVGQFVDDLLTQHRGRTVYVVTHGGVLMTLFENIFNTGVYRHCKTETDNTGWTVFEYQPESQREMWSLIAHNRLDHLIKADLL